MKIYTFMKKIQRFVSTIGYYKKFYVLVIFRMFLHFAVFCGFNSPCKCINIYSLFTTNDERKDEIR